MSNHKVRIICPNGAELLLDVEGEHTIPAGHVYDDDTSAESEVSQAIYDLSDKLADILGTGYTIEEYWE